MPGGVSISQVYLRNINTEKKDGLLEDKPLMLDGVSCSNVYGFDSENPLHKAGRKYKYVSNQHTELTKTYKICSMIDGKYLK